MMKKICLIWSLIKDLRFLGRSGTNCTSKDGFNEQHLYTQLSLGFVPYLFLSSSGGGGGGGGQVKYVRCPNTYDLHAVTFELNVPNAYFTGHNYSIFIFHNSYPSCKCICLSEHFSITMCMYLLLSILEAKYLTLFMCSLISIKFFVHYHCIITGFSFLALKNTFCYIICNLTK